MISAANQIPKSSKDAIINADDTGVYTSKDNITARVPSQQSRNWYFNKLMIRFLVLVNIARVTYTRPAFDVMEICQLRCACEEESSGLSVFYYVLWLPSSILALVYFRQLVIGLELT